MGRPHRPTPSGGAGRRDRGDTSAPLSAAHVSTLERLLDAILPGDSGPGATAAGAVHYVVSRLEATEAPELAWLVPLLADARGREPEVVADLAAAEAEEPAARFRRLRAWAWEGYLCDPARGGNRNEVGWRRFDFRGRPKGGSGPKPTDRSP